MSTQKRFSRSARPRRLTGIGPGSVNPTLTLPLTRSVDAERCRVSVGVDCLISKPDAVLVEPSLFSREIARETIFPAGKLNPFLGERRRGNREHQGCRNEWYQAHDSLPLSLTSGCSTALGATLVSINLVAVRTRIVQFFTDIDEGIVVSRL